MEVEITLSVIIVLSLVLASGSYYVFSKCVLLSVHACLYYYVLNALFTHFFVSLISCIFTNDSTTLSALQTILTPNPCVLFQHTIPLDNSTG